MTTYGGRRAGYIPGERPVNKEPPVAKYVIEKLYNVHRERLNKVTSLTDCHLHVMDFLTDQTWKKTAAYHQELRIMKHNEEMYERISKVENGESIIAKEKREHLKKVTEGAKVMIRLKECDRERKQLSIQKENEHFHARLQKAQGTYGIKKCKQWYKHHQLFKEGRRSDVTAGHIMNVPKKLLPKALPPLSEDLMSFGATRSNVGNSSINSSVMRTVDNDFTASYTGSIGGGASSVFGPGMGSSRKMRKSNSAGRNAPDDGSVSLNSTGEPYADDSSVFIDVPRGTFLEPVEPKRYKNMSPSGNNTPVKTETKEVSKRTTMGYFDQNSDDDQSSYASASEPPYRSRSIAKSDCSDVNISYNAEESLAAALRESECYHMDPDAVYFMVAQRQFAIPFEHNNCIVQVFVADRYDDRIYFRVLTARAPYSVLSMRSLTIDAFMDTLYSLNNMPHAASAIEDVSQLRSLLSNMFHATDVDNSGSLSFDEFQVLMEKIDLGITSQELRFVISEADENADGVVDYEEFVPIAVDMILAFRARTTARKQVSETEANIDESIHKLLRSSHDIDEVASVCIDKIRMSDPQKTNTIRVNELRRRLQSVAALGLSPIEINMICQTLPREESGRVNYSTFRDTLYDVRFISMKNMIMESQGSQLQNHLLDMCRNEEQRLREDLGDDVAVPGMIPFRNLINMMIKSPRLSLNRLQVMVIVSEANVTDGMVNYHLFVPAAAKAIEMMFEPSSMRVRSELLESDNGDLNSVLEGESSAEFHKRLVFLFHSHDIKHSGQLDPREFSNCMQSLELNLTDSEIFALMASADVDHSGTVSFDEFVSFCTHNLLHLEKEKRIRQLGSAAHKLRPKSEGTSTKTFEDLFAGHLLSVFQEADRDGNGILDAEEVHNLLQNMDVELTQFQLDVLMSEMDSNDDNRITYAEFVPVCAELLQEFRVRDTGVMENKSKQVAKLVRVFQYEINNITKFVFDRVVLIMETIEDPMARRSTIKELLYDPMTGLCRSEANMLLAKLCPSQKVTELGIMGVFKSAGGGDGGTPKASKRRRAKGLKEELTSLIKRVRETTIKRNLFEPLVASRIEKKILNKLVVEARRLLDKLMHDQADGEEEPVLGNAVPVRLCFLTLLRDSSLRISITQALHVIQFCECFEARNSTYINYKQFAEYAAQKISYLSLPEVIEHRGEIIDNIGSDDLLFMQGLTEAEFNNFCSVRFTELARGKNDITESQFIEVISGIPKLSLYQSEINAIVSAFPRVGDEFTGNLRWHEFMPWGYSVVLDVCRERIIGRRLLLLGAVAAARTAKSKYLEEANAPKPKGSKKPGTPSSKKISTTENKVYVVDDKASVYIPLDTASVSLLPPIEKLLDVTKLVTQDETLVLLFPNEKFRQDNFAAVPVNVPTSSANNPVRRGKGIKSVSRQSSRLGLEAINADIHLCKVGKFIKVSGEIPIKLELSQYCPTVGVQDGPGALYLPCLIELNITSPPDAVFEKVLNMTIGSYYKNNDFYVTKPVPVRLPSVGLVDKESAIEFAMNIVERTELFFHSDGDVSIRIEE